MTCGVWRVTFDVRCSVSHWLRSCLNNLATMESEEMRFHDAQVCRLRVALHVSFFSLHSSQVNFMTASAVFATALGKNSKEYDALITMTDILFVTNVFPPRYIQCQGNLRDLLLCRCGRGLLHVKVRAVLSRMPFVTRHVQRSIV